MYSGFSTRLNVEGGDEGATLREVGRRPLGGSCRRSRLKG